VDQRRATHLSLLVELVVVTLVVVVVVQEEFSILLHF
jgi:hypothetical protein